MARPDHMLTPREAARMLGISYPAIKQWILAGKLKTTQTPGGHHRVAESTLLPFLKSDADRPAPENRERYRRVSGRNQLAGRVVSVRTEGLMAEVILALETAESTEPKGSGNRHITAVITAEAVRELGLKRGDRAAALIKSTDVMIERLDSPR